MVTYMVMCDFTLSQSFNAWKRTKDERLSSRLEEIRIAENNKKDVLARAKRQKNRDGASAFSKWYTCVDNKRGITQQHIKYNSNTFGVV